MAKHWNNKSSNTMLIYFPDRTAGEVKKNPAEAGACINDVRADAPHSS
jgi:hypothetical protein